MSVVWSVEGCLSFIERLRRLVRVARVETFGESGDVTDADAELAKFSARERRFATGTAQWGPVAGSVLVALAIGRWVVDPAGLSGTGLPSLPSA